MWFSPNFCLCFSNQPILTKVYLTRGRKSLGRNTYLGPGQCCQPILWSLHLPNFQSFADQWSQASTAVQPLIVTPNKALAIFLDISPLQKTDLWLLQFDILSKGLQNLIRTFHSHNKHFLNISPFPKLISLNLMFKAIFYPSILDN